jgi:hypothetical protein
MPVIKNLDVPFTDLLKYHIRAFKRDISCVLWKELKLGYNVDIFPIAYAGCP